MCLSCGCGKPDDDHGDSRNITMDDVKRAAEAAGTTPDKVAQNIMSGSGNQQGVSQIIPHLLNFHRAMLIHQVHFCLLTNRKDIPANMPSVRSGIGE